MIWGGSSKNNHLLFRTPRPQFFLWWCQNYPGWLELLHPSNIGIIGIQTWRNMPAPIPTFPRGHCHCNWPLGLTCGHLWCCWWNNDKAAAWLQGCHKWNKSTKQWPRVKFRWCQLKTSGCHLANQDPCASYMITVRTVQKHHLSIRLHVHTFFQRGIPRIGSLMI